MANEKKYQFRENVQSEGGRISTILAVLSFLLFIAAALMSYSAQGNAGSFAGCLAFAGAAISVYGFHEGMKSFGEKNVSNRLSVIGSISCGIIMIGWLTLFLTGLAGM